MKPIRYSKQDVCSASRLLESQQKVEVTKIAQPANGFKGKYFGKISSYKLQILTRPSTLNSISITYLLQPIKPRETRRVNRFLNAPVKHSSWRRVKLKVVMEVRTNTYIYFVP